MLPPPDRSADGIGVVALEQGKLLKVLPSGTDHEQLAVSPDGTRVFIATNTPARRVSSMSTPERSSRASRSAMSPKACPSSRQTAASG